MQGQAASGHITPQKGCVRLLVCPTIDAPLLLLLLYKPLPGHLHKASIAMYRSVLHWR